MKLRVRVTEAVVLSAEKTIENSGYRHSVVFAD